MNTTPTTARAINGQTPGPLTYDAHMLNGGKGAYPPWMRGSLCTKEEGDPWFVAALEDCDNTEATAHLLATAYTMADKAGRDLGVDAAALCESLDLAALVRAARDALAYLDRQPDAPKGSIAEVGQCGVRYGLRIALSRVNTP